MSRLRRTPLALGIMGIAILGVLAILQLRSSDGDFSWSPKDLASANFWQGAVRPGDLSRAHSFLESRCDACHTPVVGPEALKCILCHANNEPLLQRQPTAFHAGIGSCRKCHAEHQGLGVSPTNMDHTALTEIGLEKRKNNAATDRATAQEIIRWMRAGGDSGGAGGNPYLSDKERVLDCATCHTYDDRHFGLFGADCAMCHATDAWRLTDFRHPPPSNVDCAQCHQAPPSHYMEHFNMMSRPVAGKPDARVDQCHLCHQTTAWPDIKGVGWYKHH